MTRLQPLLTNEIVVLQAPVQAWSSTSGTMGELPIHGVYLSDTRFLSQLEVSFDGRQSENIATEMRGAHTVDFIGVLRHLDDGTPDPRVRVVQRRTVTATGIEESLVVTSGLSHAVSIEVRVGIGADLARMDDIKTGEETGLVAIHTANGEARWGSGAVTARLESDGSISQDGPLLGQYWLLEVPAQGRGTASWRIRVEDSDAVVGPADSVADWTWPEPTGDWTRGWPGRVTILARSGCRLPRIRIPPFWLRERPGSSPSSDATPSGPRDSWHRSAARSLGTP